MVAVLILERAPRGLRGELSRWMIEPRTGVFVANLSAMVRDQLWERVQAQPPPVAAMLIVGARNEQHFEIRIHGDPSREVLDCEGLQLVRIKTQAKHKRR
ncbi:MAG: type I-E CRISPR-associated endoribonuclease Cas2 [Armatimonadetes bacterium]|nr:type I-E CRISPR-associated endoribonuclease Cas2 [Armatimonadota bacterium]